MGKYILNALSPSMFDVPGWSRVKIRKLDWEEVKAVFKTWGFDKGAECAIGHASTAALVSEILGVELKCERKQVKLLPGDIALVFSLTFRPEEGKVYSLEELKKLYEEKKLAAWFVIVE